jgi:hypothetical protein
VATPSGVRGVPSVSGGTLAGGDYIYRVSAERPAGQGTTALSAATAPVTVRLESTTTGSIVLEWPPVPGATGYRVYREGGGGAAVVFKTPSARFADTGAAGVPGGPPTHPTMWTVKNLFELKNARNVTFDGNVLERNWLAAQTGYAILLQVVNQDGRAPWSTIENVRIVNNVVRHVSAAINILGVDQKRNSGRMRGITIANNLFVDVDKKNWAGTGDFLLIGGGAADVVVEQNTVQHNGRVIAAYAGVKEPKLMEGFVFRNNLLKHNEYGVKGDSVNSGLPTLTRYFPGFVFEGNVLAGGPRAQYPPGNHFPSVEEFEAQFVDVRAGNLRVKPGSPLHGIGADLDRIGSTAASRP